MGIQKLTDIMKMNKQGVQIKNALFAVVVISVAIIAIGVVVGEYSDKYNSGITYDLSEYEDLDGISGESQSQRGKVTPSDPDPGTSDFEGKIFRGGYGILGSIFSPFTSIFNMLESLESRFGLPSYVVEGLLTLMFFALIGAIITVIFRLTRSP